MILETQSVDEEPLPVYINHEVISCLIETHSAWHVFTIGDDSPFVVKKQGSLSDKVSEMGNILEVDVDPENYPGAEKAFVCTDYLNGVQGVGEGSILYINGFSDPLVVSNYFKDITQHLVTGE